MHASLIRAVMALAIAGIFAVPPAASAKTRSCGSHGGVIAGGEGYEWGAARIKATGVSCSTAKRHVATCSATGKAPAGYTVRLKTSNRLIFSLTRGARRITWEPVGGGGCGNATSLRATAPE
jgi:hypothetical protein